MPQTSDQLLLWVAEAVPLLRARLERTRAAVEQANRKLGEK